MSVEVADDNECTNSACHAEITELEKQLFESQKRIQDGKKTYHELLVQNLKKDIQINQLQEKMSNFNEFRGAISNNAIDMLNSIDNSDAKDSLFVLTALKDLYQHDLNNLKQKSYSGQKRLNANSSKDPITPEKKNVLQELFSHRLKHRPDGQNRMKRLAKYVKQAIETINKTNK